ncbi:MAG: hypothetical protein WCC69_08505 [Pirellulales bacterium]
MNEIRINELIDRFFNCDLGGADRAALERALLRSPQARALFWEKAEMHEGLREWGLEHWDRLGQPLASGRRPVPTAVVLLASLSRVARAATIPLTLVVGSLVGMGVAWAVVPQVRASLTIPLRIANGGFEDEPPGSIMASAEADRLEQLPTTFAAWGGDRVRVCRAEQGVSPVEGRRMLAFEKALPGPGDEAVTRADACDVFQVVDLSTYRPQIARGGCMLTATAHVSDAGPERPVATDFIVRVHVFGGEPQSVLAGWPHTRLEAIATGTERVTSFGGQAEWRELIAQASLPKDATFAVLQIDATNMDRTPGRPPGVFDRHYCDDVRLSLTVPTGPAANQ